MNDASLLVAVHSAVDPIVSAVRRQHGELPALGSTEFIDAPDMVKVAVLLVTAEAFVLDLPDRVDMVEASKAVHLADPHTWQRLASDRSCRRPVGRARSLYEAVGGAA